MTWLLTGGAGYIGAHVLRALRAADMDVVVLDDLSTGVASRVPDNVPLVSVDLGDGDALSELMKEHEITGVVHLAAKKAVGESVERPLWYYRQNMDRILTLVETMASAGVRNMVYSSSAAVYGMPAGHQVAEDESTAPLSPYGETKLIGEWVVRDVARVHGMSWTALRYFNVAGAGADDLGDTSAFNLIPLVLRAVSSGERPKIFGDDYETPDGTCVRDYIHVADLAEAHVTAAVATQGAEPIGRAYNVGRGVGASVREVIDVAAEVIGRDLNPEVVARRPGDPAYLVATADRIRDELGWSATRDLTDMVASAWSAWQST